MPLVETAAAPIPSAGPATGPTRVVLVTDSDVLAGTEQHMLELGDGLARRGLVVSVACPPGSPLADRAVAGGLGFHPVARWRFATPFAALSLRRLLVDGDADVVHAHNGRSLLAATLAVTLAGRGRCVTTQHFLTPTHARRQGWKGAASSLVHRFMARRTHRIIAISVAARDSMVERGAPGASKAVVVPNGIAAPPATAGAAAAGVRREFGLRPDQPLILCAARLEPEKGIPTLVAAMTTVRATCPDAVCLIAGEGGLQDQIARLVADAGLGGSVRLIGFRSDVPDLMAAADLFVLPAPAEPFGLVLLEAMSAARPVVAVGVGGPTEIVVDGETGLLVPPDDPAALAKAIGRMLTDAGFRRAAAEAGRVRWRERFTVDRMAAATAAAYGDDQ
jgi:glycosyltransferase involved in cell wall biosynthesis